MLPKEDSADVKVYKHNLQFGNLFFTADEHYFHKSMWSHRALGFPDRPWYSKDEMHEGLIERHNEVVKKHDTVYHVGDFSTGPVDETWRLICRLNGNHYFLEGSHDDTLLRIARRPEYHIKMVERVHVVKVGMQKVAMSHWAMRSWPYSHYGSWLAYGHSHCRLTNENYPMSCDVGVDCNNWYPVEYEQFAITIQEQVEKYGFDGFSELSQRRQG